MTDLVAPPKPSHPLSPQRPGIGKLTFSSFLGNFIEWFDYATYAYFATVISSVFFPATDKTVALIQTYAVFAISFLLRPVGALFWGHRGDRHGRKDTLLHSILLMSGATFCIGLIPGHSTIGLAAPIILLLLRMTQGFSAAGEYAGAATFISESVDSRRRGVAAALVPASTALGLLAGSAFWLAETTMLSTAARDSWGWRLPFLLAGPLGLFTFLLRRSIAESPVFEEFQEHSRPNDAPERSAPLAMLIKQHPRPLLRAFGVCVLNAVGFYIVLTYLPTYLAETVHVDSRLASAATTTTLIAYVGFVLLAGALSDRFGRRRVMLIACGLFIVLTVPGFLLLNTGAVLGIFVAELGMAVLLALNDGNLCSYVPETFPTRVRLSGFALSFNTANALFGGTAPLVATILIKALGSPLAPAWYLTVIAAIALVAVARTRLSTDLSHPV